MKKILSLIAFTFLTTILVAHNSPVESTNPIYSTEIAFVEALQEKLETGDLENALNLFNFLSEDLQADINLQMLHASLLLSANKTNKALAITDELITKNPNNIELLELKANIAVAAKNKQLVKTTITQLLEKDSYNPTANIIQANQYALQKKYKLAADHYKKALIKDSKNQEALFGFAKMSYYKGSLKDSQEYFYKVLQLDPENSATLAFLGKIYAEKENFITATDFIKKAIELEPNNYDYYIDLGQYQRYQGQYQQAEETWTKAIQIDPKYFLAYTYRAGLYDEQNKIQEALHDYNKIIETNPKYYFAYEAMGILEFHQGLWAKARQSFEKANSVQKDTSYQLMIIATYLKEKNLFEAKKYAQLAMKNLDRNSIDYLMIRLYHDQTGFNAENAIAKMLEKETNKNKRGKMTYYFALYYDLKGIHQVANEYYGKIMQMQTPMFFEYRLAEWGFKNE